MDIFEAFTKRHSYRGNFTEAPVSKKNLTKIVQAGLQAPSGCNAQTTSFVIVDDPDKLIQLAEIVPKPVTKDAKAVIICAIDSKLVYHGLSFAVEDCAAAVENMLLAITALGYATVWIDGALRREGRQEKISELLEIPKELEVRIMLPIGVPVKPGRQPEKKPFAERAWFNTFGK